MPDAADRLWWVFLATVLAFPILIAALAVAMVSGQRRLQRMHRTHSHQLLTAQEAERRFVARELHDDALQRLAVIGYELDAFGARRAPLDPSDRAALAAIRGQVTTLGEDLRETAHGLHPAVIEQAGLGVALRQLADDLARRHGLEVDVVEPEGPIHVSAERALALYRIAQEGLRNVVQHAGTFQAVLLLRQEGRHLELEIRDLGRGFEPVPRGRRDGMGLLSIEERARLVGGRVTIRSRLGEGTRIRIRIPIEESAP